MEIRSLEKIMDKMLSAEDFGVSGLVVIGIPDCANDIRKWIEDELLPEEKKPSGMRNRGYNQCLTQIKEKFNEGRKK